MIVYGDPGHATSLREMAARLGAGLDATQRAASDKGILLDSLRMLLCQAGELEQAVEDANEALDPAKLVPDQLAWIRKITDCAAAAFYAGWSAANSRFGPITDGHPKLQAALSELRQELRAIQPSADVQLKAKIPEGFAFYALYPEQYCWTAEQWLTDHAGAGPQRAAVVGIRSIGATLSALVTTVLASQGWEVRRITVRPAGHPFARRVNVRSEQVHDCAYGLVVDEGPGLSGSSMAAAGQALEEAGVERGRIAFLPGHNGLPGPATSDAVRSYWSGIKRYVAHISDLRWDGQSLAERLASLTPAICNTAEPVDRIENLSGGQWRNVVYPRRADWPAVCARFERLKYRCTFRDGHAVLWKFVGFGNGPADQQVESILLRMQQHAARGWSPAPLGAAHGFVAMPWVKGTPLRRSDACQDMLEHMGRYLAHVALPPLSSAECEDGLVRLRRMVVENVREGLGESAVASAQRWCDAAEQVRRAIPLAAYGDGRMAPHEWLRTPTGGFCKMDTIGHEMDHTIIGRQSVLWDIAGTLVEWNLENGAAAPLLAKIGPINIRTVPAQLLGFYRLAYAAFRMGMCSLCASLSDSDQAEQARLVQAIAFYREQARRYLNT